MGWGLWEGRRVGRDLAAAVLPSYVWRVEVKQSPDSWSGCEGPRMPRASLAAGWRPREVWTGPELWVQRAQWETLELLPW